MRPKYSDFGKLAKLNTCVGNFFGAGVQKHFHNVGHESRKHVKRGSMLGHISCGFFYCPEQDLGHKRARTQNPKILGASKLSVGPPASRATSLSSHQPLESAIKAVISVISVIMLSIIVLLLLLR